MREPLNAKLKFSDYLLVFLLIANSGMPFFTNRPVILLISMFFSLLFIRNFKFFRNKIFISTVLILLILSIGQALWFNYFAYREFATLLIRWLYPLIVITIVKDKFSALYVDIMYYLTLFSIILFGLSVISSDFEQFLYNAAKLFEKSMGDSFYKYRQNIIIYTITDDRVIEGYSIFKRNAGPFWEAGGFGAYLIIALLFSLANGNKIFNKYNLVFITAMISTWSTGTLAALLTILFFYFLWIERSKYARAFMVPFVVVVAFYSLTELSFVSDRITRSIEYFNRRDEVIYERNRDRMVSGLIDIKTFLNSPVFGTGRSYELRHGGNDREFTYFEHRNNGLTDFLVKYGFIIFVLYFYLYRISFFELATFKEYQKRKRFGLIALMAVFLVGFTQVIFQQSVFIAISFVGTLISKNITVTKSQ